MGYKSHAQRKAVHASKADGGAGNPNKMVGYTPFKMKAKDYDNSPMKKNYGEFGVGHSEAPEKPTPAKLFGAFKRIMQRRKDNAAARREASMPQDDATATAVADNEATQDAAAEAEGGGDLEARVSALEEAQGGGGGPIGKVANAAKGALGKAANFVKRGGVLGAAARGGKKLFGRLFSDVRLKEKIKKTGVSPSGIPIYEFNYIGDSNRYSGAMAQDLLDINPGAVTMDSSGYYKVNYNDIDVDMHQINN